MVSVEDEDPERFEEVAGRTIGAPLATTTT